MSVNRAAKEKEVEELKARLKAEEIVLVTHNQGLTVKQVTEFRSKLRKEGASLKVVKNTLARRALEGTKFADVSKFLNGPTGIVSAKDPLVAARVTYNFAKDNDKLVILGALSADGPLDPAAIKVLALLPSLDALRGKLVGLLQAPAAQLARLCQAYADKGGAAAPAAAAPAEAAPAT
ncbi:MAG TPA: 50S ribosomal protein L10 [Patescibacteria group bacterium]|nr:50S ribosomal protein L10 [Patescibacteria group bacterium]